MTEQGSFTDYAMALDELGFTSQHEADVELLARDLVRAGWSAASAERAVERSRHRAELIAASAEHFKRAAKFEHLMRLLCEADPPPWRTIFAVLWSIIRCRCTRRRHTVG